MIEEKKQDKSEKPCCGIIMPISSIDGCDEQHWVEVMNIISESIEEAGFHAKLVSYTDEATVIQKTIIQNLYENPIVVCDVSGKNPNVMFELGMRLAFDKPTIIIKDYQTSYSFDTSPIEHLEYPRDLRFSKIVVFKKDLKDKIKATYKRSNEDPNYTAFLKHFGKITAAKLDSTELSKEDFIITELQELKKIMIRQELTKTKRTPSAVTLRKSTTSNGPGKIIDTEMEMRRRIHEQLLYSSQNMALGDLTSENFKEWVYTQIVSSKSFGEYFTNQAEISATFNRIFSEYIDRFL
jgi:hypothetical protein